MDDNRSMISSLRSKVSRMFHHRPRSSSVSGSQARRIGRGEHDEISSDDEVPRGAMTPLVDPSINPNPAFLISKPPAMNGKKEGEGNDAGAAFDDSSNFQQATQAAVRKQEHQNKDVSRHTFYIVNSQMRLKIHARSEVGANTS